MRTSEHNLIALIQSSGFEVDAVQGNEPEVRPRGSPALVLVGSRNQLRSVPRGTQPVGDRVWSPGAYRLHVPPASPTSLVVVIAEGVGDHGGWHLQVVLADRRGPPGGRGDAEVVDQVGESVRMERLTGASPGEEPAGVSVRRSVHVVAVVGPGQKQFREGAGNGC